MKPWYRFLLYIPSLPWDLFSWFLICCIRLFWGENLVWERDEKHHGSPVLTCDLKPNSWPARTWYTYRVNRKKIPTHPSLQERYGMFRTWGGTTLGPHSIFYGPGRRVTPNWAIIQRHEHVHSHQGEAYMLLSFVAAIPFFVYGLCTQNLVVWVMALVLWTLGYVLIFTNFIVAVLRGDKAYRGSHHEQAAYSAKL